MATDRPPVVIAVAPNGAYKTKRDHPRLPMTASELAETARACLEAGAAMIHLHVRDAAGKHSLDPEIYRAAMTAIRKSVGDNLAIQVTSEAAGVYSPMEQVRSIQELKPESVSVAVRELVPDERFEPDARPFFHWLAQEEVISQYILYSAADVRRYRDLVAREIIPALAPHWVLLVLGKYSENQASHPRAILPFLTEFRANLPWCICAFGAGELACAICAATLGGHVRVGFENNVLLKDGRPAHDNTDLVSQTRHALEAIGLPIATAQDLRDLLT